MPIFITDFCKVPKSNMMRLSQSLFEAVVYSGFTNGRGHVEFLKLIIILRWTMNNIYHMNYFCNTIQNLIREGGEYITSQTH